MTNLPRRLKYIACAAGRHEFKETSYSGYDSFTCSTLTCKVCGEVVVDNGGKIYEPPYWEVTRTVKRKGKYSK